MTQISDNLYLGAAKTNLADPDGNPTGGTGVGPMGRVYIWDTVPLALGTNNVALSQNPGSGGSFTLTAGTGVTSRVRANGTTELVLDVPRCVSVIAAGANAATYLISGFDQYGQAMSQLIAAPSTSTVTTTKAFKTVTSVTNANATAGTNGITVGTSDKLGLPVRVTDPVYITAVKWATTLADNAGTFVAADATSPATTSTTDVRGAYTVTSATDGVKRLVMCIALPALAVGPTATRIGALGVDQV